MIISSITAHSGLESSKIKKEETKEKERKVVRKKGATDTAEKEILTAIKNTKALPANANSSDKKSIESEYTTRDSTEAEGFQFEILHEEL